MHILVVEDYVPLRTAVVKALREESYAVDEVGDGVQGLSRIFTEDHDVVILDLNLPGLDGLSLLERVRREKRSCHVLITTARDGVEDRVRGLDLGADDYLVKPFAMAELLARVRALVRRAYSRKETEITIGHVRVRTSDHTVFVEDEPVELTAKEYALLEYLMLRAGEVVTRTEIWEHIYDERAEVMSNVVDVYVGYLRKKIERPGRPPLIRTRRGEGYLLAEGEA
ncbi:MAG: response regulator transcription factor [Planctomycetota bacterium]